MKTKLVALTVIIFTIASSPAAIAQTITASDEKWRQVQSVPARDKLVVHLKGGNKIEGRLLGVSDAVLTIDRKGQATDLNRQDIDKVYRLIPKSVGKSIGKSALIGAGIGFGAGAGVGLAAGSYEDIETGELVAVLGGISAAIGAGIGALVGAIAGSGNKKALIYDAK